VDDDQKAKLIGKHVCYDAIDGGACWGRIKEVVKVNTMKGEVEAFILSDRYNRYVRGKNLKQFRQFFPDKNDPTKHVSGQISGDGKFSDDPDLFLESRKIKGDSILQIRMIDLERDVVDVSDLIGKVDTDLLFQAFLDGRGMGENGRTALEIGMLHLMGDEAIRKLGKAELVKRTSDD
jgi:hypothetical protein